MPEKPLRLLLVEDNLGDARLVKEMLSEAEGFTFDIQWAESLLAALDALSRGQFDVVLTDLSLHDSQGLDAFNAIRCHAPGLPVVVLTGMADERAAVEAVRSGAQDYLAKGNLSADTLVRALRYAVIRQVKSSEHTKSEPERATIVGMVSAKGGVGTTTIACHYAAELKRQTDQKVLLVNLDVSSAGARLLLKVDSPHTILDAARDLRRLDPSLWQGVVCESAEGIDLIQSPGAARLGDEISGDRVRHVLRFVRSLYRWIVVDMGPLNVLSMNLISEVKDLFLITTYELPSLSEANRVLRKLLELGLSANRVHLVVNRVSKAANVSKHDVEKALGYPVHALINNYSSEMYEAYCVGKFLDSGLSIRKHAAQLVARSLGLQAEPSRSSLKRLLFAKA